MLKRYSRRGFTLIELVVVVLIIAIMAAIAIAQYNKTTERGRVAEVLSAISTLKAAEQRYVLKANTFTGNTSDLDQAPPTTKYYGTLTITGTQSNYTISFTRSAPVNPNYGAYVLSYIGPAGTFLCGNVACANDLLP